MSDAAGAAAAAVGAGAAHAASGAAPEQQADHALSNAASSSIATATAQAGESGLGEDAGAGGAAGGASRALSGISSSGGGGGAADDPSRQEEARAALLATRPFSEQLAETVASIKLKSQAPAAVRHLLRLLDAGHTPAVAAHPEVIPLLGKVIADGPALPAAGGAMSALARMCLAPETRARIRAEVPLTPVVRYLSLADPGSERGAPNAEPAALLAANVAADALARRALVAAGAVEALVALLQKVADCSTPLGCHVAAGLVALVAADEAGGKGQRRFVECGGVEAACKALAARRGDSSKGPLRLRLVLSEVSRAGGVYEARVAAAAAAVAPGGGGGRAAGGEGGGASLRVAGVAVQAAVRASAAAATLSMSGGGMGGAAAGAPVFS